MKFGTSGLRGLVSEMTDPVCAAHVAAFLRHLKAEGVAFDAVLVGRDLRPSSPRIAAAAFAAIESEGKVAVDCSVLPTPALALEAARRGAPAVMVTGSHIPFDRNGLKFYRPEGEITKADEAGILAALDDRVIPPATATEPDAEAGRRYIARATDFFGPAPFAGARFGVYQHSAAGRDLLVEVLEALGAEVVALGRTDGFVPIDTEAVAPEDAARLSGWILENNLDAILSTDGDGDRPLVADDTGAVLRGDTVGMLAARLLGADGVATPINANTALEKSGFFPNVLRTKIGSPFVIAGIEALQAGGATLAVGYEANGGFLLGGEATDAEGRRLSQLPTRDALVPMLALLVAAARRGLPLSELVAELPPRATASDRLQEVPERLSRPLMETLAADAEVQAAVLGDLGPVAEVNLLDGVRMTLGSGEIVHLRMSGNAPELRVYSEAVGQPRAEALVRDVMARVAHALDLPSAS